MKIHAARNYMASAPVNNSVYNSPSSFASSAAVATGNPLDAIQQHPLVAGALSLGFGALIALFTGFGKGRGGAPRQTGRFSPTYHPTSGLRSERVSYSPNPSPSTPNQNSPQLTQASPEQPGLGQSLGTHVTNFKNHVVSFVDQVKKAPTNSPDIVGGATGIVLGSSFGPLGLFLGPLSGIAGARAGKYAVKNLDLTLGVAGGVAGGSILGFPGIALGSTMGVLGGKGVLVASKFTVNKVREGVQKIGRFGRNEIVVPEVPLEVEENITDTPKLSIAKAIEDQIHPRRAKFKRLIEEVNSLSTEDLQTGNNNAFDKVLHSVEYALQIGSTQEALNSIEKIPNDSRTHELNALKALSLLDLASTKEAGSEEAFKLVQEARTLSVDLINKLQRDVELNIDYDDGNYNYQDRIALGTAQIIIGDLKHAGLTLESVLPKNMIKIYTGLDPDPQRPKPSKELIALADELLAYVRPDLYPSQPFRSSISKAKSRYQSLERIEKAGLLDTKLGLPDPKAVSWPNLIDSNGEYQILRSSLEEELPDNFMSDDEIASLQNLILNSRNNVSPDQKQTYFAIDADRMELNFMPQILQSFEFESMASKVLKAFQELKNPYVGEIKLVQKRDPQALPFLAVQLFTDRYDKIIHDFASSSVFPNGRVPAHKGNPRTYYGMPQKHSSLEHNESQIANYLESLRDSFVVIYSRRDDHMNLADQQFSQAVDRDPSILSNICAAYKQAGLTKDIELSDFVYLQDGYLIARRKRIADELPPPLLTVDINP